MEIMKKVGITAMSLTGLIGFAFACSELPMPPLVPIQVPLTQLPKFSDSKNPANALFMDRLIRQHPSCWVREIGSQTPTMGMFPTP